MLAGPILNPAARIGQIGWYRGRASVRPYVRGGLFLYPNPSRLLRPYPTPSPNPAGQATTGKMETHP